MNTIIKMPETYAERLTVALREANRAAREVSAGSDDGGTCNLDSVVLRVPKGTRDSVVKAAAKAAGIAVTHTTWFGRGYFLALDTVGQANAREQGVQTALRVLMEEHGIAASYYAQMD